VRFNCGEREVAKIVIDVGSSHEENLTLREEVRARILSASASQNNSACFLVLLVWRSGITRRMPVTHHLLPPFFMVVVVRAWSVRG